MSETTGINILKAIDLANVVRSIGGFPLVDDLLPGYVGDSQNCVLANTFNTSCEVFGVPPTVRDSDAFESVRVELGSNPWFVQFPEEKYAEALSNELNTPVFHIESKVCDCGSSDCDYNSPESWGVCLPDDVGKIAADFDNYELDDKYYEDEEQI